MSALIDVLLVGLLIWLVWVGYVRVLASKRYASRQSVAPDLGRFSESSREQDR
jgi:hypothetical protein